MKLIAKVEQNIHTLYLQESLVQQQTCHSNACNCLSSSTTTEAILFTPGYLVKINFSLTDNQVFFNNLLKSGNQILMQLGLKYTA